MRDKLLICNIAAALAIVIVSCNVQEGFSGELYSVSIGNTSIKEGERIVGFEVRVRSGGIYSLLRVPIGWSIYIDNDPSWHTKVRASVIVGAAALDIDFFKKFLMVEKGPDNEEKLSAEMEIITTTDFVRERRRIIKTPDLKIERVNQ